MRGLKEITSKNESREMGTDVIKRRSRIELFMKNNCKPVRFAVAVMFTSSESASPLVGFGNAGLIKTNWEYKGEMRQSSGSVVETTPSLVVAV